MWLIDQLAEQHIAEAMERGEFDDLPGAGQPLALEDDTLVPEELRAGYRLLKNAGYLPPELTLLKEVKEVEELLRMSSDSDTRQRARRRLQVLQLRLGEARGGRLDLEAERRYREELLDTVEGTRRPRARVD